MSSNGKGKVRYAVVGLGHIAQAAALPAFKHMEKSELVGLVSGDPDKLSEVSRMYSVKNCWSYDDYDQCLESGLIDAVFIALPNTMHEEYAVRALQRGIHVLCEKPMEMTESACRRMIEAADQNNSKLMIAYRLHFEEANLLSAQLLQDKRIGEPRFFTSIFSYQVKPGNVRTEADLGGGPLFDIGIYCLNASRYLFKDEPVEVMAMSESSSDARFAEIDEMMAVTLRFPKNRLAQFTCSFGASSTGRYQVVGTEGDLIMEDGYGYNREIVQKITIDGKTHTKTFEKKDQFAAEIEYFSECVIEDKMPEPSGYEGMVDVHIMEAIMESAAKGRAVQVERVEKQQRPTLQQEKKKPPVKEPPLVKVEAPHD